MMVYKIEIDGMTGSKVRRVQEIVRYHSVVYFLYLHVEEK